VVLAPAIMAPVFRHMFAPDGELNAVLRHVGLGGLAQPWIGQTSTALPVIMYTADFSGARMQEAMRLGAAGYVLKGATSWDDFLAVIHKHNRGATAGA